MKFPTTTRVVPELTLAQSERERYSLKAKLLVEDAIAQYETYARVHKRRLHGDQWKAIKSREGLTVYRERRRYIRRLQRGLDSHDLGDIDDGLAHALVPETLLTPSTVRSTLSPTVRTSSNPFVPDRNSDALDEWTLPTLLMVGSIVGTLDDVMYGVATFDAPSMLLKTTYTEDELVDGEVLSQIAGPSRDDPFRFLGLKWIVKGNPPGMSKLMRPRDLVFLEATGVESRWNGERYGYHLMHSEEVDGCGPLATKSVLRGRVESCTVYRQLANGTVDVYMKANVDPNGTVRKAFALKSAANGLSYCWAAVKCAQNKKLAWMLTQSHERARVAAESAAALSGAIPIGSGSGPHRRVHGRNVCCSVCRKSANAFRHLTSCELCDAPMCSKCRVAKRIGCTGAVAWRRKEITQRDVLLCKSCVSSAAKADSFRIAREEVVSGKWDVVGTTAASDISILPLPSRSSSRASSIDEHDDGSDGHRQSEKHLYQRRTSDGMSLNRTLKLSLARIDANEEFASSGEQPPLSSYSNHHWASSFDSNACDDDDDPSNIDDELEQEYYFDEQGRASEVPRDSRASSLLSRPSADFTDYPDYADSASSTTEFRYSRPTELVDLLSDDTVLPAPETPETPETPVSPVESPSLEKARTRSTSSPPEFRDPTRSLSAASSASSMQGNGSSSGVRFSLDPSLSSASMVSSSQTSMQSALLDKQSQQPQPQQNRSSRHEEMWRQMVQLRDAAEHVYQVTRQASEVHANTSTQVWPSVRG